LVTFPITIPLGPFANAAKEDRCSTITALCHSYLR
jgi:hypothetical protein